MILSNPRMSLIQMSKVFFGNVRAGDSIVPEVVTKALSGWVNNKQAYPMRKDKMWPN